MNHTLRRKDKPLVYACSGCSSAAQMANHIAVRMDREGIAEMSCIAGVGGDVKPLVRTATSDREIIAIDGCPLACVKNTLARHGVVPKHHIFLNEHGVKKVQHGDFDPDQATELKELIMENCGLATEPVPESC